jgi:hypothetical protein
MSFLRKSNYASITISSGTQSNPMIPGMISSTHCKYYPVSVACTTYTCKPFSALGYNSSGSTPYDELAIVNGGGRCPIGYYMNDTQECMYLGLDSIKQLSNAPPGTPSQVLLDMAAFGPNAAYGQYQATEDELRVAAIVLKQAEDCTKISFP